MSFLCAIFNFTILLFNVSWTNKRVDVPLNANIDHYISIPQANIYENGVLIEGANVHYVYNGINHTFKSTIQTSYVKVYTLYIEAYFEDQGVKDVARIEYNVYDDIKPEITYIKEFKINYGEKLPDFKEGLVYNDNYDKKTDLIINVDTTNINQSKLGTYLVVYRIRDLSNNENVFTKSFHIVDKTAPDIKLKKPIVLNVHSVLQISDFITVSDNYDQTIRLKVFDGNVNYHQLGEYEIRVVATDLSNNYSEAFLLAKIVDTTPPEIILRSYPEPIAVYENFLDEELKKYILTVSDNYDALTIDDVLLTHDIDATRLGTYTIHFKCSDQSLNTTIKSLKIEVVDREKPEIEVIKPFVFEVFSESPILREHFIVSDNYSDVDDLVVNIVTSYNINKTGKYDLKIEVSDKNKNKLLYLTTIHIVDLTPPDIIQTSDIMITDFTAKDLSIYFKAKDLYDGEKTILTVDDQRVNYKIKGSYDITVYAYDQSENLSMLETKVHLIDISNPTLILKSDKVYLNIGERLNNLGNYILEVDDNYDALSIDDVFIEEAVDYQKIGKYEIYYLVKDSSLNTTQKTIEVYIDDRTPPSISGENLYISMYENVDLLTNLVFFDNVGIYKIYYEPQIIDTSQPGSYVITYTAQDYRGNISRFSRTIYINEVNQKYKINEFIPLIVVVMSSIAVLYYLYKKI